MQAKAVALFGAAFVLLQSLAPTIAGSGHATDGHCDARWMAGEVRFSGSLGGSTLVGEDFVGASDRPWLAIFDGQPFSGWCDEWGWTAWNALPVSFTILQVWDPVVSGEGPVRTLDADFTLIRHPGVPFSGKLHGVVGGN